MASKKPLLRCIAFLRGINVGGHRVSMERLRALFTQLKLANVATFIASGNVIFDTPLTDAAKLERQIETHLAKALGYEVATFLRTPADLTAAAAFQAFAAAELAPGHTVHVGFLRSSPAADVTQKLLSFRTAMDEFCVNGRELYWLCRGKVLDSLVSWPVVTKAIPVPSTMRNLTTVRKLVAKYPPV